MSCKLSPLEKICMKCKIVFSGKNKKNISKCRLLKILCTFSLMSPFVVKMLTVLVSTISYSQVFLLKKCE